MDHLKTWEAPTLIILDISLTSSVCENKLPPGNDGTYDASNGNAACGS